MISLGRQSAKSRRSMMSCGKDARCSRNRVFGSIVIYSHLFPVFVISLVAIRTIRLSATVLMPAHVSIHATATPTISQYDLPRTPADTEKFSQPTEVHLTPPCRWRLCLLPACIRTLHSIDTSCIAGAPACLFAFLPLLFAIACCWGDRHVSVGYDLDAVVVIKVRSEDPNGAPRRD